MDVKCVYTATATDGMVWSPAALNWMDVDDGTMVEASTKR